MNGSTLVRLNITFPKEVLLRLKKVSKPRMISKFLGEAAREKLEREEAKRALSDLLKAPAAFLKVKDSVNYVRKMRRLDRKRLKRLSE